MSNENKLAKPENEAAVIQESEVRAREFSLRAANILERAFKAINKESEESEQFCGHSYTRPNGNNYDE